MKKSSAIGSGGSPYRGSGWLHSFSDGGVYKVLRLKTGDTVLCEMEKDITDFSYNPTIELINPINIITLKSHLQGFGINHEEITIRPFLTLSDSETFPISTEVILTMGNMKASARKTYLKYIEQVMKQREIDAMDDAIVDLLESINPDRPLLFIEHETAMIVENNEVIDEQL